MDTGDKLDPFIELDLLKEQVNVLKAAQRGLHTSMMKPRPEGVFLYKTFEDFEEAQKQENPWDKLKEYMDAQTRADHEKKVAELMADKKKEKKDRLKEENKKWIPKERSWTFWGPLVAKYDSKFRRWWGGKNHHSTLFSGAHCQACRYAFLERQAHEEKAANFRKVYWNKRAKHPELFEEA